MIYREYIRYLKSIKIHPKKSRVSRDHISFEGSNSILIVGGSNVAWPKEVSGFARRRNELADFVFGVQSQATVFWTFQFRNDSSAMSGTSRISGCVSCFLFGACWNAVHMGQRRPHVSAHCKMFIGFSIHYANCSLEADSQCQCRAFAAWDSGVYQWGTTEFLSKLGRSKSWCAWEVKCLVWPNHYTMIDQWSNMKIWEVG